MTGLDYILKQIEDKLMQYLSIAVLAISFWMIKAEGMSTENLQSIMRTLGFTFDEATHSLTANGTTYNIYQLLEYCVDFLFPTVKVLSVSLMDCIISKAKYMEYITGEECTTLLTKLIANQSAENQEVI